MPTIRLGSHDLLEYNARYGVLICRECHYAIQKSALRSHLLRHKIYRGERQRLLSSISQLDLFEPHQVPLPIPSSPPIDALPVISGYCCTAAECGNLCASSKRMRRHWSEIHGVSEPTNSSSFARPVKLQTFFRGTKLRYFEVSSSVAGGTAKIVAPLVSTDADDNGNGGQEEPYVDTATPPRELTPPMITPRSSPVDLDLETLTYFHYFITRTSLTLPGANDSRSTSPYWSTDVVHQALLQRWLMCGVLAISACHLAMLAEDTAIKQIHGRRLAQFYSEFSAGWDETTKRDLDAVAAGAVQDVKKAGRQIICILICAQWALAENTVDQEVILEPVAPFQLQSIMTTIRNSIVPVFALPPRGVQSNKDDLQEETFDQAMRILGVRCSSDAKSFGPFSYSDDKSSTLLNRLRELPYRMAETFGKPKSAKDVLATLSAIAALVECCDISFASDEAEGAWLGMAIWLIKVPDHFNHMVSHHSPAAIVVVAYWAAFFVKRVEQSDYWFLKGLTKAIVREVAERLSADDSAARSLIESLIV